MSQSTEKALVLLDLVAGGCNTLPELAEASQMPKSTVHRLASVLVSYGFLRLESKRYYLGYKLLELGELTRQQTHLPTVARKHLEATSQLTSETVHLGELIGTDIIYLDKVEGSRGLQMASRIGLRISAQTTAMGKVLIAHLPREEWQRYFLPLPPRTANTIVDAEAFFEELEAVCRQGYAFDREENELGIRCVAAPIRDVADKVVAAISISGAAVYISEERLQELVPEVLTCAQAISRELGGREMCSKVGSRA